MLQRGIKMESKTTVLDSCRKLLETGTGIIYP